MKGSLIRRGARSWRLKYDLPSDPAGRRVTKFVTLRGTRRQAQEEANKILAGIATGTHVDASQETVAQFVERWLRDWADHNVCHKTGTRYAQLLRGHLAARVGHLPLQKLRAADLQSVIAAMAQAGLADRTRLHMHRVTHTMLKHAAQWGAVARNIATLVDAPRVQSREVEILTPAQLQTVLETLRGRALYPLVATALGTGLRRGELLALRWQDIDLDGRQPHLRVERTLEQTKRAGLLFKAPKTKYGRRLVTLPASTVTLLREHRKAQLELRMALGLGKEPDDTLVFSNWDGSTRSPNGVTKEWTLAMRKAGLKATLHSLRHTHASTLIASGLNVLTISRRLGHGSPAITLGIYGHLFKTDDRAAAIMEAALAGPGLNP
jgi:integrase